MRAILIARRTLADMTEEYWDQIMDLNLKSVFLCTQAVWEEMAARKSGIVINVSSIAGRNGGGLGAAAYATAKGGLMTYTKSLGQGTGSAMEFASMELIPASSPLLTMNDTARLN